MHNWNGNNWTKDPHSTAEITLKSAPAIPTSPSNSSTPTEQDFSEILVSCLETENTLDEGDSLAYSF